MIPKSLQCVYITQKCKTKIRKKMTYHVKNCRQGTSSEIKCDIQIFETKVIKNNHGEEHTAQWHDLKECIITETYI